MSDHEHTWKLKGHYNFGDPVGRVQRVRCACGETGFRRPGSANSLTGEPSRVVFTWSKVDIE